MTELCIQGKHLTLLLLMFYIVLCSDWQLVVYWNNRPRMSSHETLRCTWEHKLNIFLILLFCTQRRRFLRKSSGPGWIFQQQHLTTTSPCVSRGPVTLLSCLYQMHAHMYILPSNVTHIKMGMNWFISDDFFIKKIIDSSACYITYCFYTFMLEPFTVHPQMYYFHECISSHCITFIDFQSAQQQHFVEFLQKQKQTPWKTK